MLKNTIILVFFFSVSVSCTLTDNLSKDVKKGCTHDVNGSGQAISPTARKDCTKPGFMCEDCKNVSICILLEDGTWTKKHVETCVDTCLESTGTCTTGPNPDCDNAHSGYKFICRQVGFFPDPFDCQKYHLCIPDSDKNVIAESVSYKCPDGYSFDAKTQRCSHKILRNCPIMGNPCSSPSTMGPVDQNRGMYFVCFKGDDTSYYPQFFMCPNNQEFDKVQSKCVDPSPISAVDVSGKCIKKGMFYDPDNCLKLLRCSEAGLDPVSEYCAANHYFNNYYLTQSCLPITCAILMRR